MEKSVRVRDPEMAGKRRLVFPSPDDTFFKRDKITKKYRQILQASFDEMSTEEIQK